MAEAVGGPPLVTAFATLSSVTVREDSFPGEADEADEADEAGGAAERLAAS